MANLMRRKTITINNTQTQKRRQNNRIHTANRSNNYAHTYTKTLELLIPLLLRLKTGQDQRAIKKIKRDIFRPTFSSTRSVFLFSLSNQSARAAVDGRRENEEEIEYKSKECEKGGYNEER